MILNKDNASKVAEFLLQIKAVKLSPSKPFTWASGWKSPIYCDTRITLSYPTIRTFIRQAYADAIRKGFGKPDLIAGVATGGIPQGALIAQELGVPFIYVRSSAKGHGMGNQVEGYFEKGQKVVVIEDLISTGGSGMKAINALRNEGLDVKGLIAVFTYGFTDADKTFKAEKVPFQTLSNYDTLLKKAVEDNYIKKTDVASLKEWKKNPDTWDIK